jgi:NitT/TauT family transport system substrate-binding protein
MSKILSLFLMAGLVFSVGLASRVQAQESAPVRVAVMPVLDALPLFIAQEAGYFEAAGLEVELIPVAGPVERDTLLQTGEGDAMIADALTVGFFNESQTRVQIVYTSRHSMEGGPVFRLLAAPESGLSDVSDLAGVGIGVSSNTIVEYLAYRLLENAGVEDIQMEVVPAIPQRFELLMAGQVQAVVIPDPLGQAAIGAGAILVADDTQLPDPSYSQSVLVFSLDFIQENPDTVAAFVAAWDQAVLDLNADPEAYRELLLESIAIPESVQATYQIPPFPRGLITTEEIWEDYMAWMLEREILETAPAYADSVNPDFLPTIEE